MKVLSVIALDGSPSLLMVLLQFSSRINFVQLKRTFSDPDAALRYIRKFPVDLLFLDFEMPAITASNFIPEIPSTISVIGMSSSEIGAVEGFELQILDFLVKPFSFERFNQAVRKAAVQRGLTEKQQSVSAKTLFVRADYSLKKINLNEVLYIEALDDYLKVHLKTQKTVVAKMTMKTMLDKLDANDFIRVHRSFIVPVKGITQIRNKVISIEGINIPIGTSYEQEVKKLLDR